MQQHSAETPLFEGHRTLH